MRILFFLFAIFFISGCVRKEVNGIKIGHNLYDIQTKRFNDTLCLLIENTLQKDSEALDKLININDGGAAGSYDHGDILVQILVKIGEQDFIKMISSFNKQEKRKLKSLLDVGIEYGSVTNLKSLENDFPKLSRILSD